MSHSFPLIRAAALMPVLHWLAANGRPVEQRLREAGLGYFPWDNPDRPIAAVSLLAFLGALARSEGPDIGCRVVSEASIELLSTYGRVILGVRTPRQAIARAAAAMPHHCTHERMTVVAERGGVCVRDLVSLRMTDATRHIVHQYVAALLNAVCTATGRRGPLVRRVELTPHPEAGLDHLRRFLGPDLAPTRTRALSVFIPDAVLDTPLPAPLPNRRPVPVEGWSVLRADGTYADSARLLVETMLDGGPPTVEALAAAAGTSRRTLQRRLAAEGTAFSNLLDEARRARALRALASGSVPIGEIAASLGYTGQPAFTRAVRRWTAAPPRQVRQRRRT